MIKANENPIASGSLQAIRDDLAELKSGMKDIRDFQLKCRLSLNDIFFTKSEFVDWKMGRQELKSEDQKLWDAINYHSHDLAGGVLRK